MVLKFYYDLASAPARAVYFTIKNLNLDVELVDVSLFDGEHKSEAYLKVRFLLKVANKSPLLMVIQIQLFFFLKF